MKYSQYMSLNLLNYKVISDIHIIIYPRPDIQTWLDERQIPHAFIPRSSTLEFQEAEHLALFKLTWL